MSASAKTNRPVLSNEQRARGIAAMGLVTRDGEKFRVSSPVLNGKEDRFEVWRDESGNVRCTCPEAAENNAGETTHRCEHILAVKHMLLLNNGTTQSSAKGSAVQKTEEGTTHADTVKDSIKGLSDQSNPEACEWSAVADILDRIAPRWSSTVRSIQQICDHFVVVVSITIDGISRDGIGTANATGIEAIQLAEHDAIKQAATRFAFYRANKRHDLAVIDTSGSPKAVKASAADPVATSLADLVMPKQLGMIRALARGAGVEADDESVKLFHCKSDSLNRKAAAEFIDHLKGLQQERAGAMRRAS